MMNVLRLCGLALIVIAAACAGIGMAVSHEILLDVSSEINIRSDSASGWVPSENQRRDAIILASRYFSMLDEGQYDSAYAMMAEINRRSLPFHQFVRRNEEFGSRSGPLKQRCILKVTWTKDPASAPLRGIYAAIDIASRYGNGDRYCGYVVLYQRSPGESFEVMRQESNFIDNVTAELIEQQKSRAELDSAWSKLAANCPNFSTMLPKVSSRIRRDTNRQSWPV